ncbi:hypothetical protein [Microbacterium sp. MPKO10]|uniref:hypothetical protein n=1 Tax=Microbacterium sp. MPKO10 TaxID=2989818 RepID=UPI002235C957|nr:hypothetical protein [Microbacterium sp. MPKO10]MCW4456620.1 hypothetical protein [Microbacterium sp. MPKO10]
MSDPNSNPSDPTREQGQDSPAPNPEAPADASRSDSADAPNAPETARTPEDAPGSSEPAPDPAESQHPPIPDRSDNAPEPPASTGSSHDGAEPPTTPVHSRSGGDPDRGEPARRNPYATSLTGGPKSTPDEPPAAAHERSTNTDDAVETDVYPQAPAARPAPSPGSDHAVTDAYTDNAPTEHLLTGPEPTRSSPAPTQAAPVNDPLAGPPLVELPTAPKRRGNRWAGIGIGIIQAVLFAAAMFGVLTLLDVLAGEQIDLLGTLLSPALLITVGMFFIGLIVVALLVNRAGWWSWILGGLLVAVFAYVGWIGGLLVQDAMSVPSNRVLEFIWDNLLTWPAIAAFLLGREIPIWFGAWTAARGRKVAARNREERDEYERQRDESEAVYR